MQRNSTRRVVLVVTEWYEPGFKAGGILRALKDLVDRLGAEFDFRIITSDRDLNEPNPYPNIHPEEWGRVGSADVLYLPPKRLGAVRWLRLLRSLDYDVLYLNSFFSHLSVKTLALRRLGLLRETPTIVAPHGEFSRGAIALKAMKKSSYLALTKSTRVYADITFQATSELERDDIQRVLPGARVCIAPYALRALPNDKQTPRKPPKEPNAARILFLSRIARKKNVDFAIQCLAHVRGEVDFEIVGPIEDVAYWRECENLIAALPPNIRVTRRDAVAHDRVADVFRNSHAFLFPTRGENFGYVTLEALGEGCVVITSDQTPWRDLRDRHAGWDIPLSQRDRFVGAIEELIKMDAAEYAEWSSAAVRLAVETTNDPKIIEANRQMFTSGEIACDPVG